MAVQSSKKSSATPWPALLPMGHHAGKPAISLKKTVILVGSRHNAHLHLLSRQVSKAHALILSDGGSVYIRDLASREQIYVNGVAEREAWLEDGDLLKVGSFTFKYTDGPTRGAGQAGDTPPEGAVLEIEGTDAPIAVAEKVMLIGRRATCDIALLEASVSTAHAVLFHVGGKRFLRDLGSRTGTWVNGAKIHQVELSPGDSIKIGETEMRYASASEHDHMIAPADSAASEVDELEHLVGTAHLDMAAEIKSSEPISRDLEADLRSMFGPSAQTKPAKDEDLIELEIAHEPRPAPAAKAPPEIKAPPRPQPQTVSAEEPIALEPEAPKVEASKPAEADWDAIDLSADPDVADLPSAADTKAIGMKFEPVPAKPTISERVVDEPLELEPEPEDEPAAQADEVLLGHDLIAPTESAHSEPEVGVPAEEVDSDLEIVEEVSDELPATETASTSAAEDALEATWPADAVPTDLEDSGSVTEAAEDAEARRSHGWQKMSRPEEEAAGEAEAPLPLEDAIAPVEEVTPAEEPIVPVDELIVPTESEIVLSEEAIAQAHERSVIDELAVTELPVVEDVIIETDERSAVHEPVVTELPSVVEAIVEPAQEIADDEAPIEYTPPAVVEESISQAPAVELEVTAPEEVVAEITQVAATPSETAEFTEPVESVASYEAPVAEAPPVTETSAIAEPFVEAPVEPAPVLDSPTVETPVDEAPLLEVPAVELPVTPLVEEPLAEIPGKKGRGRKGKATKAVAPPAPPPPVVSKPVDEKPKKRGRKSKKEKEAELRAAEEEAAAQAAGVADAAVAESILSPESVSVPADMPTSTLDGVGESLHVTPADEGMAPPAIDEAAMSAPIDMPTSALDGADKPVLVTPADEGMAPVVADDARVTTDDVPLEIAATYDASVVADEPEIETFDEAFEGKQGDPVEVEAASIEPAADAAPPAEESAVAEEKPLDAEMSAASPQALADELEELEELPEIEPIADEQVEPMPFENSPGPESNQIAPDEAVSSEFAPAEPVLPANYFSTDVEDFMPVLELDTPELEPASSHRDPDVLLALDQVDPDLLDDVEVIDPTQPTVDSALDLEAIADQEVASPTPGEASLTDSVFGRQMEEFTATSSGEIVEELPEIEEFRDADEELAIALDSPEPSNSGSHDQPPQGNAEEWESQPQSGGGDIRADVTAGGIEPSAMGAVTTDSLNSQQFDAAGESVLLETPGVAEADAVLGSQEFVGDAGGQDVAEPTEALTGQAFVAEGDAHTPPPTAPPRPIGNQPAPRQPQLRSSQPAQPAQGGGGFGGGFVMGADLSSFIGGMPLVLPELPPQATGFGRKQVSFTGPKAHWEQSQRPSFPIGQGLAQELMGAAEGLRDVEDMDEELEPSEYEEDSITDEGAPGDEWNVAGVLDDQEAPLEEWIVPEPEAETQLLEVQAADTVIDELSAPEATITEAQAEEEAATVTAPQETAWLEETPLEEVATEHVAAEEASIESPVEILDEHDIKLEELDELHPVDELASEPVEMPAETPLDEAESSGIELETFEDAVAPEVEAIDADDAPQSDSLEAEAAEADVESVTEIEESASAEPESAPLSEDELLMELDARNAPPMAAESIDVQPQSELVREHLAEEAPLPDPFEDQQAAASDPLSEPDASTSILPASPDESAVEELAFIEPEVPSSFGPRHVGAIEEAVAELKIDEIPEADSIVDRSPPPKVTPPGKSPKAAKLVPPPPARNVRPRKSAEAQPDPVATDTGFGSLEHGVGGAPFAGMGGVREIDVFSQASESATAPGPADSSVFGAQLMNDAIAPPPTRRVKAGGSNGDQGGGGNGDSHYPPAAEGRRPQRAIVPPRMSALGAATAVADVEAGEPLTRPAYRVIAKRASIVKTVVLVVVLMLACMGLAFALIHYFVQPKQASTGELRYANMRALTRFDRDEFRKDQLLKLTSPPVLISARSNLAAASVDPGFLRNEAVDKLTTQWSDDRPDVMTIQYVGGADLHDKQRIYAMLLAMYEENHAALDQEIQLKAAIADLQKKLTELDEARAKRAALKKIVDASLNDADIQALKAKVAEAEGAYDIAVASLKDAQLDVRRAEEQLPPSPGEKSLKPGDAKPASGDADLVALQKALEEASGKITAVKSAASEEADAKRKMLDQAIEVFQQTAAGLMKENPQLAQYVQAVQQLQEKTHKLSGDLIEVQQQLHNRLSNLKKDMDDQVQARRIEIWAADKGLIDLRAQLDLAEREYHAAIAEGMKPDSTEVKAVSADIGNLTGRIDARKMTLGNDPIVTRFGEGLQEIIKITKERLESDRQRIEKDIKDQELAFAQSNTVEKLPDTQKAQAAALKAKQEAVNDLRKQYAQALDRRTTEANASLRELEGKVSDLTGKIDERKRVLAANVTKNLTQQEEAHRRVVLEQKQLALKKADEEHASTQKFFVDRTKALNAAMATRAESEAARRDFEALNQSLASASNEENVDKLALDQKQGELKKLVTVVKPIESDVKVAEGRDDRMLYTLYSVAGLAVVFVGILAMISVKSHNHRHTFEPLEVEELPEAETGPLAIQEIGRRSNRRDAKSAVG
jgi:pSer/pThr/pTyr-binding forkhead associated (FHA) protein